MKKANLVRKPAEIILGKEYYKEYEVRVVYCQRDETYKTKKEATQKAKELEKDLKKLGYDVKLTAGEILVCHEE